MRVLASRTGRSEAEHVRTAVREYLLRQRQQLDPDGDPLLDLIGLVDDPDQAHATISTHFRALRARGDRLITSDPVTSEP